MPTQRVTDAAELAPVVAGIVETRPEGVNEHREQHTERAEQPELEEVRSSSSELPQSVSVDRERDESLCLGC